jgi:streptomycin 6-kinase
MTEAEWKTSHQNLLGALQKNITSIYGTQGQKWLDELPVITSALAKKYNLHGLIPVKNMSFNYVAQGYQDARPIVLKLGLDSMALAKEAKCLKAFSNHAGADFLDSDEHMILMQRAVPGTTLKEYFPAQEKEAIKILCSVIKKLHSSGIPDNHNYFSLENLLQTLDQRLDIPDCILSKARNLRDSLLSSTHKKVLLHGDLHHDNILKNNDEWLVIDPKGFIGDPAFEPTAFLCNPTPELLYEKNSKGIIFERIKLCAKILGVSEQRIQDWLYVKTALCWAWSLEDNLVPGYWRKFLEEI